MEAAKEDDNKEKDMEEKKEDEKVVHKILFPGVTRVFTTPEEAVEELNFDC